MTIIEWFESVEDETIRNSLLRNIADDMKTDERPSLADAIKGGFSWDGTKEGYSYWEGVFKKALLWDNTGKSISSDDDLLTMDFAKWTHSADCNYGYSGVGDVWLQLDDIPRTRITTKELLTIFKKQKHEKV